MDLLRRAVQKELTMPKAVVVEDPMEVRMDKDTPEDRWRRVALRCHLILNAARWQAVLLELSDLPNRRFSQRYNQDSTWEDLAADTSAYVPVTRAQVFARQMLPRSESVKHMLLTPEECAPRHRELIHRGGRTFWFTCKACGSRWPRSREERLVLQER